MSQQNQPVPGTKCKPFAKAKVKLPSGLILVMTLEEPSSSADINSTNGNYLAILLHPWSWLGGSMNDPVLHFLSRLLKSYGFYTIRYNSRGVGGSSGWRSFTGLQEGLDLQEVVQWAIDHVTNVQRVVLVGYSHGSLVAAQHPVLSGTIKTSHILLSYPFDKIGLLTLFRSNAHSTALKQLLASDHSNVLIIYGDHDEFTSGASYKSWEDELQKGSRGSGKLEIRVVHGGTHFWRDEDALQLKDIVSVWAEALRGSGE